MTPIETEDHAYAKFWSDQQTVLWYVMVYSGVVNRPFPSSPGPLYQSEVRCSTFLVEMSFICMRMKNHFHIKG